MKMSLKKESSNKPSNLPYLGIDIKFDDVDKLQEALESQIDIVLKLEEERLKLLKENKQQKQIIEELTISKNTQKNEEIKMIHQSEKKDQMIQTGEEKEISKNSLLEEAMMLVNKHDPKMKSSVYGGQDSKRESQHLKQSALTTKRGTQINNSIMKENDASMIGNIPKISEKELLTQEIVKLTKESNNFKFHFRKLAETIKKLEKENSELKKSCEVKNETLEKLRKEIADLSKILNTDKFKSIKTIENDLFKALSLNKSLQGELILKEKENSIMQEDLNNLKLILEKLTNDYEGSEQKKLEEAHIENERNMKDQEKTIEDLKQNLKFKEDQLNVKEENLKEMMIQNENLNEEVEYFKSMAKSSKTHAEKALNDLDFYRNKLLELQKMSQGEM